MIGAQLRQRRKALGLTQVQLAERLGVPRSTLTRWETGTLPLAERGPMLALALAGLEAEKERTMRREELVERVAGLIWSNRQTVPEPLTDDEARALNRREGWTFDTSVPGRPDNWIRHEGVHLSDADMDRALALATRYETQPDDADAELMHGR